MLSVLYLLAYFTVLGLSVLVLATVERRWELHTWYSQGDIDVAVAALVIGGVILPLTTLLLVRLSGRRLPGLNDHLRQSTAVYAVILATAAYLVVSYSDQRYSLGWGVAAIACLLGFYAVGLNGLVLWLRSGRARRDITPLRSSPRAGPPAPRTRSP
jgi:hypothetical protein